LIHTRFQVYEEQKSRLEKKIGKKGSTKRRDINARVEAKKALQHHDDDSDEDGVQILSGSDGDI